MGCIEELKSLEGGESGDGLWVCQTSGGIIKQLGAMTFADKVYNLKVLDLVFHRRWPILGPQY